MRFFAYSALVLGLVLSLPVALPVAQAAGPCSAALSKKLDAALQSDLALLQTHASDLAIQDTPLTVRFLVDLTQALPSATSAGVTQVFRSAKLLVAQTIPAGGQQETFEVRGTRRAFQDFLNGVDQQKPAFSFVQAHLVIHSLQQIRAWKKQVVDLLARRPEVTGVGIAKAGQNPVVRINLSSSAYVIDVESLIQYAGLEHIPISFAVSGQIVAYSQGQVGTPPTFGTGANPPSPTRHHRLIFTDMQSLEQARPTLNALGIQIIREDAQGSHTAQWPNSVRVQVKATDASIQQATRQLAGVVDHQVIGGKQRPKP